VRASNVLARLRAGKVALGANVSLGPAIITAGFAGKLGIDFIWIDMEHRGFTYHDAALMILAGREGGTDPMVRVPDVSPAAFHRCFEFGAAGVMMQHCKSVADAEHAVACSKFRPVGRRGLERVYVDADFGTAEIGEFMEWHNRETFVAIQIEDVEALEVIDEISAVPGVDVLFIGPADLSQSLGAAGRFETPEFQAAVKKVARACEKNNKWWGAPAVGDLEKLKWYIDLGGSFFCAFEDYNALVRVWQSDLDQIRNLLAKEDLI